MPGKEFIVCDGMLMVREVTLVESCFSSTGLSVGRGASVTMRPATLSEVDEYKAHCDEVKSD